MSLNQQLYLYKGPTSFSLNVFYDSLNDMSLEKEQRSGWLKPHHQKECVTELARSPAPAPAFASITEEKDIREKEGRHVRHFSTQSTEAGDVALFGESMSADSMNSLGTTTRKCSTTSAA